MRISWLDVFTDRPLGGNPLAVIHDADGLGTEEMQAVAAEIGLSETIFVRGGATELRIFTPEIEMPLAGHPVVGASVDLARRGIIAAEGRHVFRTGRGETPVDLADGTATMTQAPPEIGPDHDPAEIAPLLGLRADALVSPPGTANTAVRFVLAEVASGEVLSSVEADQAAIGAMEDPCLGLVAWCALGGGALAQRMFAPRMGIAEDPATGAAAGALAALRVARGAEPGPVVIHQGSEIGRPSLIHASAGGAPGAPADIRVGGTAVLVFEGEIVAGVP